MNANATPDLRKLPPAGTSPAHQDASCPRSDIPFTPIEAAFLKLFARDDIFGGIAPALAEVVDALQAAHRVYGLERYRKWADGAAQFERRVEALEAQGRPELGLPSTDEENLTPGDMLSRLEDNSLDADELLRIRALFGARIAGALSKNEILPRSAVAAHESLLICRRNRSRQHEDWRTVCGHADVDETGLRALKLVVKSTVVRDFIDDSLMALAGAIVDPSASAAAPQAPTAEPGSSQEPDSDHEDPTEHGYGQPADIEIPRVTGVDAGATSRQEREQAAPDQPPADGKISLIGWRIVDGLHAPFTRRLGITTTWGASPLADHASVCRSLKHDFTVGDLGVKNKVCVAYHSQQCSLPPQLVLTVPLMDTGGLFYDVAEGCYWAPYAHALGKDEAPNKVPPDETPRYGRMRIYIDPDLAQHHREQYARLPDAMDIGELVEAGALPEARASYLKRYRAYLRKHGDSAHPQYAGRHARSLGPAVKEITGSDVLAMFLALDGSMVAAGMLHYVTLSERFVHAQQQRVLARLGWKPPPDLDEGVDEVLGADNALPWSDFIMGWKCVQAEATEALAALGHPRADRPPQSERRGLPRCHRRRSSACPRAVAAGVGLNSRGRRLRALPPVAFGRATPCLHLRGRCTASARRRLRPSSARRRRSAAATGGGSPHAPGPQDNRRGPQRAADT